MALQVSFSKDLLDNNQLQVLLHKSDAKGAFRAAQHFGAICTTGAGLLLVQHPLIFSIIFIIHGILLAFLFCPLHEATHGSAFKSKKLNEVIATICGVVTANSRLFYKLFHFAHHRYTQNIELDPELGMPKPTSIAGYIVWVSGWHYWRGKLGTMMLFAFSGNAKAAYVPKSKEKMVVKECRCVLAFYILAILASLLTGEHYIFVLWIGPILVGQVFLRLYLLSEHHGCDNGSDMLSNVRTITGGRLINWLAWNMPYHTEHHLYPSVPFHALPTVHAQIKDSLVHTATSHFVFNRDYIRSILNLNTTRHLL